ncbi:MAG TPA: hypothetical protein VLQ68_12325 [Rhizobiaceae bacterium]|nr:hypothetical protein [Rhizobiaceae bacterium]
MQNGLLIALAFAVLIIVLAVVVTWLTRRGRPDRGPRDGRSAATWEGIRQARNIDPEDR